VLNENSTPKEELNRFFNDDSELMDYFRNLSGILIYIVNESDNIDIKQKTQFKNKYFEITKNNLMLVELILFFYYVAYNEKGKLLKDQIKDVNFFDGLNKKSSLFNLDEKKILEEINNG